MGTTLNFSPDLLSWIYFYIFIYFKHFWTDLSHLTPSEFLLGHHFSHFALSQVWSSFSLPSSFLGPSVSAFIASSFSISLLCFPVLETFRNLMSGLWYINLLTVIPTLIFPPPLPKRLVSWKFTEALHLLWTKEKFQNHHFPLRSSPSNALLLMIILIK